MVKKVEKNPFADLLEKLTKENSRLETIFFYENIAGTNAKQGLVCLDTVGEYLKMIKLIHNTFSVVQKILCFLYMKNFLKTGLMKKISTLNFLAQKYLKALNFNRQFSYQFFIIKNIF